MTNHLLEIDRVTKRFGDYSAVTETSFSIDRGEFLAIMGSSGCGKTTMLRMLAGLEQPSTGEIRLDGKSQNGLPAWERDLPLVWQSLALFPFLSVLDNVAFGLKMRGVGKHERHTRAQTWLKKLELSEFAERNVSQLSGGQRQRVALARALVTEPKVLLLDEPLSALDAHLSVRMQALLRSLQRELGITFVYVTHSQTEAFSMADRVVVMSRGKVEQIGAPKDIYRQPANRFVAEFIGNVNIFRGKVDSVVDGVTTLTTPRGTMTASIGAARAQPGMETDFFVNADQIALGPQLQGENQVSAKLLSYKFVGSMVTLYLELPDGDEMKVSVPEPVYDRVGVKIGDTVRAAWPATAAQLFKKTE
ncbi:ABC transporter ATP-binding protein [Polaromonas sp. P1(28)-13]|nr:ABC transporter ATP-binding protein [Polaromonas sp. P1(28)-13]